MALHRYCKPFTYSAVVVSVERLNDPKLGITHSQQHTADPGPFKATQLLVSTQLQHHMILLPILQCPTDPRAPRSLKKTFFCNTDIMRISVKWLQGPNPKLAADFYQTAA